MHNDAYASDAYAVSGPLGKSLKVTSASYGIRECATIAFDSKARIVGLCGGLEGFAMMVIDPVTLKPISELRTSARNLLTGAIALGYRPLKAHLQPHRYGLPLDGQEKHANYNEDGAEHNASRQRLDPLQE